MLRFAIATFSIVLKELWYKSIPIPDGLVPDHDMSKSAIREFRTPVRCKAMSRMPCKSTIAGVMSTPSSPPNAKPW